MINNYDVLKDKYPEFEEEQRTPNGIDLKLGAIYKIGKKSSQNDFMFGLFKDDKKMPLHIELEPKNIQIDNKCIYGWSLYPHVPYILEIENDIKIDSNAMQTYYPRSTLLRCGCTLHTAVGDAGYKGKLAFLFINHSANIFVFEKGVRFAQLVDHQLTGSSIEYNGCYQENKHKEVKE